MSIFDARLETRVEERGVLAMDAVQLARDVLRAWATRGPFAETGVYLDGCFRVIADRDKLHQAVKPLSLMERFVTIAPVGGVIVDPFVGSGSTCAAAVRAGAARRRDRDQSRMGRSRAGTGPGGRQRERLCGADRQTGSAIRREIVPVGRTGQSPGIGVRFRRGATSARVGTAA